MVKDKQKPRLGEVRNYCASCKGAYLVEGEGWIGKHIFPCANKNYGWFYTIRQRWNGWQWMFIKV